jgi:hypothetical protein
MTKRTKKWLWRALGAFAILLIIAIIVVHTYLAAWLLDYVNNTLANIPGYTGKGESLNIDLYRGAYRINNLVINKKEGTIPTPFVAIDHADLSLQWSALFDGRIVSNIELEHPVINFAVNKGATQAGTEADWTKPIKDLMPIDINRVAFENGKITYQDFSSNPKVDIFIDHMSGEISNLRNVEDKDHPLPSKIDVAGDSIGKGTLKIHGTLNILKPVPDMNILMSLENVDLPALNTYSEAYASFAFKSGKFNLYSHLVAKESQIDGFVKPMLQNLSVDVLKHENPAQVVWDTIVAGVMKLFTNPSKDQFATEIPLTGNLKNPSTNIWVTLTGIFSNAFVQAMQQGFSATGEKGVLPPPESKQQ